MFKNLFLFHITSGTLPTPDELSRRMAGSPFIECAPTQDFSAGWIPPRNEDHGVVLENIGGQLIARVRVETKTVPPLAIKRELNKTLDAIEKDTGRRPRGKQLKMLKEEVVHKLLPRAFPKQAESTVWIDRQADMIGIDASSESKADEAMTGLLVMIGSAVKIDRVITNTPPIHAMADWLINEPPPEFSVDRECKLENKNTKATVVYQNHALDISEIADHIRHFDKQPVELAMTYKGRVSFTMTETGGIKGLEFLDVSTGDTAPAEGPVDLFDANVAIETGELRRLTRDLIVAMGDLVATKAPPSEPAGATA